MQYFLSFAMRSMRAVFEYFWLITAVLFVSSAVGWHQYLAANAFNHLGANQHTVWDAIAFTIMLAPLRSPLVYGPDVPLLLNIGRVLLPFMFVGGIFKVTVLRTATEKRVNQWFARTFSQHAVICGLSHAGFALVCELLQRRRWVVLIDLKGQPALLSRLQQALVAMPRATQNRFALIEGDASSTEVLETAGAQHAKEIYAATEDDNTNVDIATAARALNSALHVDAPTLQIHVHFKDYVMRDPLKHGFKLFDSRTLAGRQIVNQYPADAPWLASRDFSTAPHAMLIGLGSLGEQVALQLARTAHYANGQRMHITIVDAKASEVGKSFLQRYPMFDPDASPTHFGMPTDAGNCMSLPVVTLQLVQTPVDAFCSNGFSAVCAQWGIPGAIYVCLGNDIETDRMGKALVIALERSLNSVGGSKASTPQCTIVNAMRRLTINIDLQKRAYPDKKVGVGNVEVVEVDVLRTAAAAVVTDDLERLAERTHNEYMAFSEERNIKTADQTPWSSLDDEARQMNYNTTDHHLVRLREMGIDATARDLVEGRLRLKSEQIDLAKRYFLENREAFAAAEHRRWAFDKLFFGWRHVSGNKNNKSAKLNCSLVGYESLTDDVKQYDRDNVERVFHLVQSP
jgi:hypothetical protein